LNFEILFYEWKEKITMEKRKEQYGEGHKV
jgi:hypothetical protein